MKKLVALFIVVAAFLSLNNDTLFSQPQVTVHVFGGYNVPLPDLKGDIKTSADSNTYFVKSGFNVGADGKYYLGKKRNVGITLSLTYNSFSSGDVTTDTSTANLPFAGTFTNKINSFTAGLGVEYAFMPKGKANPFIGIEFTGNFFSGETKFTPTTGTASTSTLKSASRFGIAGNLGVDIMFNKSIGGTIGVKYNMANLIGKDSSNTTTLTEHNLDDKETSFHSARSIQWIQLYAGVAFFFNRPKTKTK